MITRVYRQVKTQNKCGLCGSILMLIVNEAHHVDDQYPGDDDFHEYNSKLFCTNGDCSYRESDLTTQQIVDRNIVHGPWDVLYERETRY